MNAYDHAYWLADKIPAYGDYAKEAAWLLCRQADEIRALRHTLAQSTPELRKVRNWINTLPESRPKGTAHISMVLAQAMKKLGMLD